MAKNCPSISGLKQDQHSNALQLLLFLLERHNGGRWETITVDFTNKSIKSLAPPCLIQHLLDCHPPHLADMPTRLIVADEGNSTDSLT
jgi:hypothetical protein